MIEKEESHLDVYESRYELHQNGEISVYQQGPQNIATQRRYSKINLSLENGFLENMMSSLAETEFSQLSNENVKLVKNLVNGITSEVGRGLVEVAFLQMVVKSICPDQSIRLHKGGARPNGFSWKDGISMRSIDNKYIAPFLRKQNLLKMNKDGAFMTRSLAENYPYSKLYKAEMQGPFDEWIKIVDALENGSLPPNLGLRYLTALLNNRSESFAELAEKVIRKAQAYQNPTLPRVKNLLKNFFNNTAYSARAFEVVIHGLMQAMQECGVFDDLTVVPLSQMRSANKKHGNIGDIELKRRNTVIESWDAKYGKPYLRDELEELRDKILDNPGVENAGFIVDSAVDMRNDIVKRVKEIQQETDVVIDLFSFDEWLHYQTASLNESLQSNVAKKWLIAVVESFAQKRPHLAPIEEPCDEWLNDLSKML